MRIPRNTFLDFFDYPADWQNPVLLPDEIIAIQLGELLEELGQAELAKRLQQGKYGFGSEHFRCGAMYAAFRRLAANPDSLDKLQKAIEKDPDPILARAIIKQLFGGPATKHVL